MSESSDLSFSPTSRSSAAPSKFGTKSEECILQEKNAEFSAQLISWVKKVTILFDHSHKQYRNAEKKLEAWNYVKNKIGYLGEPQELADHFKIIRDRYTKAKRKVAAGKPTKFQFLEELSFLDPHITDRSSWYEKVGNGSRQKIIKTPKINNSNFYLQLIEMVRQNPCFYDTSDVNYRKYCYKCQVWSEIAAELQFEGDHHEIYKQWKKLRDRYVREIRKIRLTGRSRSTCKWEFFDHMDWMEPFIEEAKPLEDFEIPLDAEDELPKPIYENGRKRAEIKFLKPAKNEPKMPKLVSEVALEQQVTPAPSYVNYQDSRPPIVIYANPNQTHTSIILTGPSEIPVTLQPEVTYYIEENVGEQYVISSSDMNQYELDDNGQAEELPEHSEVMENVNFPTEVLISTDPSSSNVIYAVNKYTDLSTLPENIRLTIEAQGKDLFKDKSIVYVK